MRLRIVAAAVGVLISGSLGMITGCGSCSDFPLGMVPGTCKSPSTGPGTGGGGTSVTVSFTGGTPLAVATQSGTGAFVTATAGNQVTFTVPTGTTQFAVAYLCPAKKSGTGTVSVETILENVIADGTSLTADCGGAATTGAATGNASSGLSGTTDIEIRGSQGLGTNVGGANGPFTANLVTGSNDVGVIAINASKNVLGVKMLRGQTAPGQLNGGQGIVLLNGVDSTTTQNLTMTGIPANFVIPPQATVQFTTSTGTQFNLSSPTVNANPKPFAVVPAAATLTSDSYIFSATTNDTATHNSSVGITTISKTVASPISMAFPAPWSNFTAPAAAKFPSFTFNYGGFNGLTLSASQASILWATGATTANEIRVQATPGFLGTGTTIAIPDLSTLNGFLAPAATGVTINFLATILATSPSTAANSSLAFVANQGSFTQP